MSAPSVRSVMSMSIKTGSWKKDGNGAQWLFPFCKRQGGRERRRGGEGGGEREMG